MAISPCLPYISLPPNNISSSASTECCELFSSTLNSGGGAVCLCYLVCQPLLLGFPINTTRLLFLQSVCEFRNSTWTSVVSLESLCQGSPTLPPLGAISEPPTYPPSGAISSPPSGAPSSPPSRAPSFAPSEAMSGSEDSLFPSPSMPLEPSASSPPPTSSTPESDTDTSTVIPDVSISCKLLPGIVLYIAFMFAYL